MLLIKASLSFLGGVEKYLGRTDIKYLLSNCASSFEGKRSEFSSRTDKGEKKPYLDHETAKPYSKEVM